MNISEWVLMLEPMEQAYVRQCFQYWNGTNGECEPEIPEGMSKSRADVLRYHCQSLNNGQKGHRKMQESKPFSVRMAEKLKRELAFEAAELDISMSEYVLRCINIGRALVMAYPDLSKNFDNPKLHLSTFRNH